MHPMLRHIERLQGWRSRSRDLAIDRTLVTMQEQVTESHRNLGSVVTLWRECLPEDLAARTVIVSLRRGVLHVCAESSATRFEVDRLLRGGLMDELRRGFRGTLTRVKVTLGDLEEPAAPASSPVRGGNRRGEARGARRTRRSSPA